MALAATSYDRRTITRFGSASAWPVMADEGVDGTVSMAGRARGVSVTLSGEHLIPSLGATVANVTEPMG